MAMQHYYSHQLPGNCNKLHSCQQAYLKIGKKCLQWETQESVDINVFFV